MTTIDQDRINNNNNNNNNNDIGTTTTTNLTATTIGNLNNNNNNNNNNNQNSFEITPLSETLTPTTINNNNNNDLDDDDDDDDNNIFHSSSSNNIPPPPLESSYTSGLRQRIPYTTNNRNINNGICMLNNYNHKRETQSHDRFNQWKEWLAKTSLGSWFTEISIEAASGEWLGPTHLTEAWQLIRPALKRTFILMLTGLILICICIWFIHPLSIISALSNSIININGIDQKEGLYPHGDYMPIRLDSSGTPISYPLPLLDLLYKRIDQVKLAENLLQKLSISSSNCIRQWKNDNSIEPSESELSSSSSSRSFYNRDNTNQDYSKTPSFQIKTSNYHNTKAWSHFIDSKAVRGSLSGHIEKPYPKIFETLKTDRPLKSLFLQASLNWIKTQCKEKKTNIQKFISNLIKHGTISIKVTDYIQSPSPPPNTIIVNINTNDEDGDNYETIQSDDKDDNDNTVIVTRNVSSHELHSLMSYLAKQGAKIHISHKSSDVLETQLGNRISLAATLFQPAILKTLGKDLWQPVVRDQLNRLDQEQNKDLMTLRNNILWSGLGGCICAHHVGAPIPGVAWYEPSENKAQVLFYPVIDNPIFTSNAWKALQWFSSSNTETLDDGSSSNSFYTNNNNNNANSISSLTRHISSGASDTEMAISWLAIDPVLNDDDDDNEKEVLLQIPTNKVQKQWSWVEGIDYQGQRQRHRVSARSLACIIHCNHFCK